MLYVSISADYSATKFNGIKNIMKYIKNSRLTNKDGSEITESKFKKDVNKYAVYLYDLNLDDQDFTEKVIKL